MHVLKKYITALVDGIFPLNCLGCREPGTYLCTRCLTTTRANPHVQFIKTQYRSVPVLSLTNLKDTTTHRLIHFYKYQCVSQAHVTIKQYVQKMYSTLPYYLKKLFFTKPLFIPVPLHALRLSWRGFNQADTIAQALTQATFGLMAPLIERTKNTTSQVGKEKTERQKNMQEAFAINKSLKFPVSLAHTLIAVDDVITTGSTLIQAIEALHKRYPYSNIACVTVAYKPLSSEGKNDIL